MPEEPVATPTIEGLRAEYQSYGFGQMWFALLQRACQAQSRRYPPQPYGAGEIWNVTAIEDLVQDVAERLVGERQLAYILDVAVDVGHVRALLNKNVKWTLADRRKRTIADNLLERAEEILTDPPFVECSKGPDTQWCLSEDAGRSDASQSRGQLIAWLRALPRYPGGTERLSSVWSRQVLRSALEQICKCLGTIAKSDLRQLFRETLTFADFTEVVKDDAGINDGIDGLTPAEQTEALSSAEDLLRQLTQGELAVLRGKWAGLSDGTIGESIGKSRPTVDKLKRRAEAKVRESALDLNERVLNDVLRMLFSEITLRDGDE